MSEKTPYKILGLPSNASLEEIKTAYRRLAIKYHPDRNPGDKVARSLFDELTEAYKAAREEKQLKLQDNQELVSDPRKALESIWESRF